MAKYIYYRHLDGHRHRCEIIEETETQVKVQMSEESARMLRFDTELWLPKSYVNLEDETVAGGDDNGFRMSA